MDFFILFAALGLVALARITIGLGGMPKADLAVAIDWAAVRAQILNSLGAEAMASRAQRAAATQRRMAKSRTLRRLRARRVAVSRRSSLAKASCPVQQARRADRAAAKAARRVTFLAKCREATILAKARAVRAEKARAVIRESGYGIAAVKAVKLTRRAEQYALAKARRAEAAAAKATAKAAARVAGKAAADAAFAAQQAAKQPERDRKRFLSLLADKTAVRLAHAVVRAGAKATAKEDFLQWLDENGHTARGEAFVAANQAAWVAGKAKEGYLAHFGFSAEMVTAADKAAYERRAKVRAIRKAAKAAQEAAKVAA